MKTKDTALRSLVYDQGGSHKFWSVKVAGVTMTVTWGRIGTAGRSKSERFQSAALASTKAEASVREKLRKGYVKAGKSLVGGKVSNERPAGKSTPRRPAAGVKPSRQPRTSTGPVTPPPSYSAYVARLGTGGELERKVDRHLRRTKKLPGFPTRLLIYPATGLKKAEKIFQKSLIPLKDLKKPRDHSGLRPFGDDTERTWICWDPSERKRNGEMMICFIDGDDGDARTDAGYDLKRVLSFYERTEP
jgi:predicted DNA-binding WGR domain protein